MRTAILASQNRNKIVEIKAILEKYGLEVISRDDAGIPRDDIEETGTTFEDNSYLKDMNKEGIDFNFILNKDENFKIVFIILIVF